MKRQGKWGDETKGKGRKRRPCDSYFWLRHFIQESIIHSSISYL